LSKTYLVAVNEREVTREMMHLVCKLARLEKASLRLVYVYEVPRALPLEAEVTEELEKGDRLLDEAAAVAEEYNLDPVTDIIQARAAGPGIVGEANDLSPDLLVIGMTNRPRFGDLIFGRTLMHVLQHCTCPVWVIKHGETGRAK